MTRVRALLLTVCVLTWPGLSLADEKPTAEQLEFFESKIRPVLVAHCYECHSAKAKTPKGGLLLDTRAGIRRGGDSGPAVVPRDAKQSGLLEALRYETYEMPPQGKLPAKVIADFERWIRDGAVDPRDGEGAVAKGGVDYQRGLEFWAFQPPRTAEVPAVKEASWPRTDVDRFVMARLEQAGLHPAGAAARRTLIRRAYFDLIGLPPQPEEVAAFVADSSPEAFDKVIEHLLSSPHYGERWGRRWLDIVRYGEDQAHTFKARKYPQGYRYRDWVVRALNDDMPYDRFLFQQIAGDLTDAPRKHERLAALGMFALGPVYYQDNGEKAKALADEWDDRVDTLMRGAQGLTVACARCHDHKYDPISTSDYYALAGVFASSQYQERPMAPEEEIQLKKVADDAVRDAQLAVDRCLAKEAVEARERVAGDIAKYMLAAWRALCERPDIAKQKKQLAQIARREKVSEELLKRWVEYLAPRKNAAADDERQHLAAWRSAGDAAAQREAGQRRNRQGGRRASRAGIPATGPGKASRPRAAVRPLRPKRRLCEPGRPRRRSRRHNSAWQPVRRSRRRLARRGGGQRQVPSPGQRQQLGCRPGGARLGT